MTSPYQIVFIENAEEILLIIKTNQGCYPALEVAIKAKHQHECPEIIALPIVQGFKGYLQWIDNSIQPNH